jgi:hypothetical protein
MKFETLPPPITGGKKSMESWLKGGSAFVNF